MRRPAFDNSNQQSLQAQLDQLTAQADTNGRSGYGFDKGLQDRIDAARARLNGAAMSANAGNKPVDEVAAAKQKILDYTAGRGDAVMNDAMTNAALQRLDAVSSGKDAPFTQAVQNQQLAQQAGMNATAAGDQGEQLRMQAAGVGGSLADPSYQARLRQINAQRQSSNANAQGQISTNAQLQNFGARQTGTNALLGGRMGQLGMANSQYNQAAGYLNQTSSDSGHVSGVQMPATAYNFSGGQPLALPPTPPIQYQQAHPQAQQPAAQPAGTQETAGQYTNNLLSQLIPSILQTHGGTPVQAPYSNSPIRTTRPQGPAQAYTF